MALFRIKTNTSVRFLHVILIIFDMADNLYTYTKETQL